MSRGLSLTGPEVELLYGLPHLAQVLFLAIRLRMDYRTGTVGVRPDISWFALSEALYVEPGPGMRGGRPSPDQVRRAARWLVKSGLVQMRSIEAQRKLIFFLPLSKRDFFAQSKAASKPPDQAARPAQRENNPKPARPSNPKPATHPDSVSNHNNYAEVGGFSVDSFEVSPALRAVEPQLRNELKRHPGAFDQAQAALDELAYAQTKGAIQKGPIPYFRAILKSIEAGTFTRTAPPGNAPRRARSTPEATTATAPAPASRDTAAGHMRAIGELMKGR